MNRPARIVLIRHAESERNKAKKGLTYYADDAARSLIKGIPDYKIALTKEGEEQARKTGIGLKKHFGVFDYVYHSGYKRTIDTMEGVLAAYTKKERAVMQIRENEFIRERHAGYTYDMTEPEAEAQFPYLKEYWKTQGGFFARPPGGESLSQMKMHVYLFINMLIRDRAGEKVLIFLHGGSLSCFRMILEHWGYEKFITSMKGPDAPQNCGVTVYDYAPKAKRLELKEYNTVYY